MPWSAWTRTTEVEPSLYAADFADLGTQVEELLRAECRIFHFDIGDGHFVEPITMGPIVLKSISPLVHRYNGAIDVHLMAENPTKHFGSDRGGRRRQRHVPLRSSRRRPGRDRRRAQARAPGRGCVQSGERARGRRGGGGATRTSCSACRSTPAIRVSRFARRPMGACAGCGSPLPPQILIEGDGGVSSHNIRKIHDAGATLLVAGSAIFEHDDLAGAYRQLVQALA